MMKIAALVALILVTCGFRASPSPEDYNWLPPAYYRAIWASAQSCIGKRGDYDRLRFRIVPKGVPFKDENGAVLGRWDGGYRISLADEWKTTAWVVKHEMIHVLLQKKHTEQQRIEIWGRQCHATWGYLDSDDPNYIP